LSNGSAFDFPSNPDWLPNAGQGTTYHVGDFNGDGKTDLLFAFSDTWGERRETDALSNGSSAYFPSNSNWLPNDGQGTAYHVGDFNGDGKTDLLFAFSDASGVWHNTVALSNGSAFYFPSNSNWLPNAGQGTAYHVGDFNGDGKTDLLFAFSD